MKRRRDELEATRLSRWGLVGFALLGIFVGGTILGLGELEPRSALAQANGGHFTPGWPDPVQANTIRSRTGAFVKVQTNAGAAGGLTIDNLAPNGSRIRGPLQSDDDIDSTNTIHVWQHSGSKLTLGDNTLEVGSANATIQSATNKDLNIAAQGTAIHILTFATGDGSANATRATIDSNGLNLAVAGEALNGPAGTLLLQAGGTNQSVSIRPTNGSGVDSTDALSVQAAGGSWTTSGTTLIDLTAGALNFPAGGKFGGGTAVVGLHHGSITLSAGSGTATVGSAEHCVCTDTTANASVKCAVASTTLTATGTGTDVISFLCVK